MIQSIELNVKLACDVCGRSHVHDIKLDSLIDIKLKRETVERIGYCTHCENSINLVWSEDEV